MAPTSGGGGHEAYVATNLGYRKASARLEPLVRGRSGRPKCCSATETATQRSDGAPCQAASPRNSTYGMQRSFWAWAEAVAGISGFRVASAGVLILRVALFCLRSLMPMADHRPVRA
jgi:hypothetical protein